MYNNNNIDPFFIFRMNASQSLIGILKANVRFSAGTSTGNRASDLPVTDVRQKSEKDSNDGDCCTDEGHDVQFIHSLPVWFVGTNCKHVI